MPKRQKKSNNKIKTPFIASKPGDSDMINNLNNDCLATIFQQLSIRDKYTIPMVCKRWRDISDRAWENVKTFHFSELQELPDLYRNSRGAVKVLKKCGQYLNELTLRAPFCDHKIMPFVGKYCGNLTSLDIYFPQSDWNWNAFFPLLKKFRTDGQLNVDGSFPSEIFRVMPPENLLEISIDSHPLLRDNRPVSLPDIAVTVFDTAEKLSVIELKGFSITLAMVNTLYQKSNLTSLTLWGCTLEAGLDFTLLTNLQHLDLSSVGQITNKYVIDLSNSCQNLKSLILAGCPLTDEGLMDLSKLINLEELNLSCIHEITDYPLARLYSLRQLECEDCEGVENDGIITLMEGAPNLTLLGLLNTGVTKKVLNKANEIVKKRTNNLTLAIDIANWIGDFWNYRGCSPLLDIYSL